MAKTLSKFEQARLTCSVIYCPRQPLTTKPLPKREDKNAVFLRHKGRYATLLLCYGPI